MLRNLTVFSLVVLIVALWPSSAYAHVLESDGDISAVLHIPPDDAPIAGEATIVSLAFAAESAGFDIKDYRVELRLYREAAPVQAALMQPVNGSDRNVSAAITFPETGAYRLVAKGIQRSNDGSRVFELQFDVRAISASQNRLDGIASAGFDFWALSTGSIAVLLIIALYQIRKGKRYAR